MADDPGYEPWLEHRRSASPTCDLADRIMDSVSNREAVRQTALLIRIGLRIERLRFARYAVCLAALLIGATPFLYLAYVAQLIVF